MTHIPVTHIAVVGGGISGLAGAYRLRRMLGDTARITLIEQAGRLGGALRTVELAGVAYDVGAEAFLVRRPEALALVTELDLAGEVVHPGAAGAGLRVAGVTRPLPGNTLLGVPAGSDGLAGLAGVLSTNGLALAMAEPVRPMRWNGGDVAVGSLITERFGAEVTERLVDPLLGGVYAGHANALGLRATMPALALELDTAAASGRSSSLTAAAAAVLSRGSSGPVFGALCGGMQTLVDALAAAARAEFRHGLPVRAVTQTASGWRLEIGAAPAPEYLDADAVLLAVPPPALRRLLAGPSPAAAAVAAGIELASSVIVALALPGEVRLPAASGVLVAAGEPLHTKAFTYSSRKWPHLRGPHTLLRASLGRAGEVATLQADDDELIKIVRADLAALTGVTAAPVDAVVARWGGGLAQYLVGHTERIAALESAVARLPGLAVASAALHGVGIAACIATADAAAAKLAAELCN